MFTADFPLMSPVDRTEFMLMIWRILDARDELPITEGTSTWDNATEEYRAASQALINYIVQHPLEVFDIVSRGLSSRDRREYWCFQNRPNGSFDPKHTVPYSHCDGGMRMYTMRQMYDAPYNRFGVQASPPLTRLMTQAAIVCTYNKHEMTWHLLTDDIANGVCKKCQREVLVTTVDDNINGLAINEVCDEQD